MLYLLIGIISEHFFKFIFIFIFFKDLGKCFPVISFKCSERTAGRRKLSFLDLRRIVGIAIQSAAQSWRAQLSTTNIVLAEVFTADNWENRQVDAFSDYVRLRELDRHRLLVWSRRRDKKNLILTKIPLKRIYIYAYYKSVYILLSRL